MFRVFVFLYDTRSWSVNVSYLDVQYTYISRYSDNSILQLSKKGGTEQ